MKKKTIAIAGFLLAASLCFGLAACKSGTSLKDFPAETTETAELGTVYELKTQVEDNDGTMYRVSSQVVTQDGGAVPVFENKFDVSDVSGYTITYTAMLSEEKTQKSVVTLNVTDNTAPTITINKPENGVINAEYCLPNISVSDLAGTQPTVAVKVYLVQGESKTEVTGLAEREGRYYFTPDTLGSYQIEVTASKANGQSKTVTRTFVVDQPVLEGEVFSPDVYDPSAQVEVRLNTGDTSIDLTKLKVESGAPTQEEAASAAYKGNYLKIDGSQIGSGWVNFFLTPRQDDDAYAEYDKVCVWLYFEADENSNVWNSLFNKNGYRGYYAANTWQRIVVDREAFVENVNGTFLSLRFNSDGNANFDNLKAIRIGSVMAVNDEEITTHETLLVPPIPEARYGHAGEVFEIPSAQVMVDGLIDTTITPTFSSATFTQNLKGSTPESISSSTFTPLTGGTLSATFRYAQASNQSIDVSYTISAAQAAGNVVFSPATANGKISMHVNDDALITAKAGDTGAVYQGSYLEVKNNGTGWNNLYLNLDLAEDAYSDYDQFGIWVYFDADADSTVRPQLFNSVRQVYTANEWHCILVDRALFMENIADLHVLFTAQFGVDNAINFDNLQAIRLGEIVALDNDKDKVIEVESEQVIDRTVLQTYSIPSASVANGVSATADTAVMFRQGFNGEPLTMLENAQGDIDLSALGSGTIYVMYTCDGGLSKTVTVNVASVENTTDALLDMRSADVLQYVSTYVDSSGNYSTNVSYNESGNYLVWTDVNSSSAGAWPTLGINFFKANGYETNVTDLPREELIGAETAYLKVEVYYVTIGEADPTGFFCNQQFTIGSTSVKTGADNIPRNSWYTVYIPVSYLTDNVLKGQHSLIQTKFESAGNWNFDNVQEVRLKGFVPVTEDEIPDGMFVDMQSLGEDSVANVFGSDYGTQLSYVSATDAERAHLSWTAGESTTTSNWCNLYVKQLAAYNAHDLYDYVAVELYYAGVQDGAISWYFMAGGCVNTEAEHKLVTNQWITVYLPIEKYFGTPSGGSGYFMECIFDNASHTHFPGISEVRIGNIFFTNTAGGTATDYVFTLNA